MDTLTKYLHNALLTKLNHDHHITTIQLGIRCFLDVYQQGHYRGGLAYTDKDNKIVLFDTGTPGIAEYQIGDPDLIEKIAQKLLRPSE